MKKKKRWFLRILVALVVLLLLLAVAVQVILSTELPRQWVMAALQQKLQLRMSATSLTTGWSGHTTLTGVNAGLPLAGDNFLQARELTIKHTSLLGLIVGRPMRVDRVEIRSPDLLVRQRGDGKWNLEEVAELIRRAGGGKTPETAPQSQTTPTLPEVVVTDARVRIVDVTGRQATLQNLAVLGHGDGPLVWKIDASIPGQLAIDGEVAPGANWGHRLNVKVDDIGPIVRPFFEKESAASAETLAGLRVDGRWVGEVAATGFHGRLDLNRVFLAGYTATGPLSVAFGAGQDSPTTITPIGLVITAPKELAVPPARAAAGTIALDGKSVTANELSLAFGGGEIRVAGSYAWAAGAGQAKVRWTGLILPEGTVHAGELDASLRQPWPGQPVINLTMASDGRKGADSWSARLKLDGRGTAWDQVDWTLSTPSGVYRQAGQGGQAGNTFDLSGLNARLATRGTVVTLDDLALPPGPLYGKWKRGTLAGLGRYDRTSGEWYLYVSGDGWPVSPGSPTAGNFRLNADGNMSDVPLEKSPYRHPGAWARLNEFYADGAGVRIWAYGDVSYRAPGMPADLWAYAWFPPVNYVWTEGMRPAEVNARRLDRAKREAAAAAAANAAPPGQAAPANPDAPREVKISGILRSELHVTGAAFPPRLTIGGTLYAKDFQVKDHPVGDVAVELSGTADDKHVQVATTRLELLSGIWRLAADHAFDNGLTTIGVDVDKLSLAQLDNFSAPPADVRGTFAGHWDVWLPAAADLQVMRMEGRYTIKDLAKLNRPEDPLAQSTPPTRAIPGPASAPRPSAGPTAVAAIDDAAARAAAVIIAPANPAPATAPVARADSLTPPNPRSGPAPAAVAVAATRPATAPGGAAAVAAGGTLIPIADTVTGRITATKGVVKLDAIQLTLGKSGRAQASASFPVTMPTQMKIDLHAQAWPLAVEDVRTQQVNNVLLWLDTTLDADLKDLWATGPLNLHASVSRGPDPIAEVGLTATMDGRTLKVDDIKGTGLGGAIEGAGQVILDDPLKSFGHLAWNDVDAQSLVALVPEMKGLVGKYTGTLKLGPTDFAIDRRATGPFTVLGSFTSTGGDFKGVQIGGASFTLYLDTDRAVLDQFTWDIARGTLKGWARITNYAHRPFAHVTLNFEKLSLDEIVRAGRPPGQEHKPVPGLLAGDLKLAGDAFTPQGRQMASGDASVRVTESDLANVDIVNFLYSVMSIKLGQQKPSGKGYATARLEGKRLEIPTIRYTNRGVDAWASGTVVDVFEGTKSPIEGSAAGSARPLKDLKLPFMADVDKLVSALQGGLATVEIGGTVGEPKPRVITFAQAGEAFRRFMVGEVTNEVRGTAGR